MIGAVSDKEAIARFFEAVNERDLNGMKGLLSPNAEFYFPKTNRSSAGIGSCDSSPFYFVSIRNSLSRFSASSARAAKPPFTGRITE